MNTLEQAWALIANGYEVFPVDSVTKRPKTVNGFHDATTHGETVIAWFEKTNYDVAVPTGELVILDVDIKPTKDGRVSLSNASVEHGDTFTYSTPSGGFHEAYRAAGEVLSSTVDYEGMLGIDRRGYGGYIRVPSGVVLPAVDTLKVVPQWFTRGKDTVAATFDGSTQQWINTVGAGVPDGLMRSLVGKGSLVGHNVMLSVQAHVIKVAGEGHPGGAVVLSALRDRWVSSDHASGDAADEWDTALRDGIAKFGAPTVDAPLLDDVTPTSDDTATPDNEHGEKVAEAVERLRISSDAKVAFLVERGGFGLFLNEAVTPANELAEDAADPHLIEGVLDQDEVTMLFGDSYTGKTYLALDWALSIASGTPWLGKPTVRTKVLYLAMEGEKTLRKRIKAWESRNGVTDVSDLHVYGRTANLMHDDTVSLVADTVKRGGYGLVVIDTLSRSVVGANDSDTEAMGQYVGNLAKIRESGDGTSVVVIHHSKKDDPEEYRGSTVLFAAMDRVICFKSPNSSKPDRKVIFQKVKDSTIPPVIDVRFDDELNSAVLIHGFGTAEPAPVYTLRSMLLTADAVTQAMLIAQLVGSSHYKNDTSASNAIKKCVDAELISKSGNILTLM